MSLKITLESALKDALRAHDEPRKSTIRLALAAIRLAEIDKGSAMDDNGVLAVLQKEVKSRQESIADAQRANRPDLESAARQEIQILQEFLPQPLTAEELETLVRQAIAEAGATSAREIGQVMKILMPRLQGRAAGDQASQAVRKLLQS